MKLARKEIIQACEKQMLRMLFKNMDKSALKAVIREKYDLWPGDDIVFHGGDMIIENSEIAYRLDFSVRVGMSVMIDRQGEHVEIQALKKNVTEPAQDPADSSAGGDDRHLGSEIARMLSEINQ